ncbi:MAG: FAD-binding oxidoreductase, partial [Alphaproteobacteria bacterium]
AAAERDRLFPLSLGAEGSCQIGGNISTNAGGTGVLRYGAMRELTLGLEVVLPEGRVWNGLRRLRKDNTGYDLKQVFVGAEGTLGIITAAVLKLFPAPRERHTAFAAVRDPEAAIELLTLARETSADAVAKFELVPRTGLDFALLHIDGTVDPLTDRYDHYVLVEFWASTHDSGLGQALEAMLSNALEAGLVLDATIAQSEAQRQQLWHIREAIVLAQRHEGASIKNDIAVPVSAVPVLLRRVGAAVEAACPGIRPCPFGHVGDGNIHYNLTRPIDMADGEFLARWDELTGIVNAIVDELDGSFSAEHGIGKLKRADLKRYRSPIELELMRTLKHALDPHNRMNPGKIV